MKSIYLLAALFMACVTAHAAPVPAPPPASAPRWEYCEISSKAGFAGAARPGAVPANPVAQMSVRFVTAETEVEGTSWEDLATKLKAADAKGTEGKSSHKMRVFNRLGAEGWEVVEYHRDVSSNSDVWTFKRKAF